MFKSQLMPIALLITCAAQAQLEPDDALSRMRPAEGFTVSLFASEPDLWNPTSMDVDARGRVWIAEAVNYRLFNQERTSDLGDRIRVLEDTDGDGRCDKATTFYQHPSLQAPMGIAVLGDRVYVCQSPDLFYLEDIDGDGVADKRTVILTGFGGIDNDHAIHGVVWGPDGRLYMSNGDQGLDVTDKQGNRVHAGRDAPLMAATVLRTDLEGNRLEWLAQGMRNPYEPAIDSFGNVFISDNDDDGNENTRINYVFEGGNYGYWPRREGDRHLESIHWNMDQPGVVPRMIRTGFGSPCGLLVYEGSAMPERVRGALLHAEAGPGEIRAYYPRPDGAGFAADQEVLLRCENDSWFRPVDVAVAPDGSIFIADWYDPGVGGHRMGDVIRGRVYRLTNAAVDSAAYRVPPLDVDSDAGLREAFASPNIARRFVATGILSKQIADGDISLARSLTRSLISDKDAVTRARALWFAARSPKVLDFTIDAAITSESVADRVQAVRVIADADPVQLLWEEKLLNDESPQVRRQLLLEIAPAVPGNAETKTFIEETLLKLAERFDGSDRFYREAIGIAFRGREESAWNKLVAHVGDEWNAQLAGFAIQLHPPAVVPLATAAANNGELDIELRKLALQALDATRTPDAGAAIASHVDNNESPELVEYALQLLAFDGGDVWRNATDASGVDGFLRARLRSREEARRDTALAFIAEARREAFVPDLFEIALDTSRHVSERVRALLIAAPMSTPDNTAAGAMLSLLADDQARVVAETQALLGRFNAPFAREQLLNYVLDESRPHALRRNAANQLVQTKSGATALLKAAEDGIPFEIEFDVGEALRRCRFDDVRMLAGQILPPETTRDGTPLPTVGELMNIPGDASRGRALFFSEDRSQCYQCHIVAGEGRTVGPDLSRIGEKYGKDGLLESILNPSAAISHEYVVWVVDTRKGDVVTGYLRKDAADGIELVDSTGNVVALSASDIAGRYKSAMSLMPNGLAAGMTAQELADVVAFLESLK